MSAKKSALGRGFDSLIPTDIDIGMLEADRDRVKYVHTENLKPGPQQPRREFDEDSLKQLSTSIVRYGILQPLVVVPNNEGYYIVAGERRWRAAQMAGLKEVPVIVRTLKELEQLEIALIENIQRVDLHPLDQAASVIRLKNEFHLNYRDIAARLGKAETTISNMVRLLQLPAVARDALKKGEISEGHARTILSLADDVEQQAELLKLIIANGWSVRQAEAYVRELGKDKKEKSEKPQKQEQSEVDERATKSLGLPVIVRHGRRGGSVTIRYANKTELQHILSTLAVSGTKLK